MSKDIYILGSGGFAKEVFVLLKDIDLYNVRAFVDLDEGLVKVGEISIPVITEEVFFNMNLSDSTNIALGTGDPNLNARLIAKFKRFSFPNLIHPNTTIDKDSVVFGKGNIITSGVIMTTCINIGDFNIFNLNVTVGHDVIISDFNVLNPSVNVSGGVNIGSCNLIGVSSCILQYCQVGDSCTVGASALVTKNVENGNTVVGIPAKPIKKI